MPCTVRFADADREGEVLEELGVAAARSFVQSEGGSMGMLPCMDAAVLEMKKTELVLLRTIDTKLAESQA